MSFPCIDIAKPENFLPTLCNFWSVTLPVDKLKWLDGICNCPAFFKKFMCKHVVGLAMRLNYCKPPSAAKDV
jgi:uncharacterized Zn finger protein